MREEQEGLVNLTWNNLTVEDSCEIYKITINFYWVQPMGLFFAGNKL